MMRDGLHETARAACDAQATPAGGADPKGKGRGCRYSGTVLAGLVAAGAAQAGPAVDVPSGQAVTLQEVLIDDTPGEVWLRFRFLAPEIADGVAYDVAAADIDHLCKVVALPYIAEYRLTPVRIVISLADREVPFGMADPDATQFFEAYRQEGDLCILEEF